MSYDQCTQGVLPKTDGESNQEEGLIALVAVLSARGCGGENPGANAGSEPVLRKGCVCREDDAKAGKDAVVWGTITASNMDPRRSADASVLCMVDD
jgi:hypothetical protein